MMRILLFGVFLFVAAASCRSRLTPFHLLSLEEQIKRYNQVDFSAAYLLDFPDLNFDKTQLISADTCPNNNCDTNWVLSSQGWLNPQVYPAITFTSKTFYRHFDESIKEPINKISEILIEIDTQYAQKMHKYRFNKQKQDTIYEITLKLSSYSSKKHQIFKLRNGNIFLYQGIVYKLVYDKEFIAFRQKVASWMFNSVFSTIDIYENLKIENRKIIQYKNSSLYYDYFVLVALRPKKLPMPTIYMDNPDKLGISNKRCRLDEKRKPEDCGGTYQILLDIQSHQLK